MMKDRVNHSSLVVTQECCQGNLPVIRRSVLKKLTEMNVNHSTCDENDEDTTGLEAADMANTKVLE